MLTPLLVPHSFPRLQMCLWLLLRRVGFQKVQATVVFITWGTLKRSLCGPHLKPIKPESLGGGRHRHQRLETVAE